MSACAPDELAHAPNLGFFLKLPENACRVGIELPSVEVRFEDLEVTALAYAAGRQLPSIFNAYRNWFEVSLVPLPIDSALAICQYVPMGNTIARCLI